MLWTSHRGLCNKANTYRSVRTGPAQVDAGRTKHIGISNHNIPKTKALLEHARIKPAVNQVEVGRLTYFSLRQLTPPCSILYATQSSPLLVNVELAVGYSSSCP